MAEVSPDGVDVDESVGEDVECAECDNDGAYARLALRGVHCVDEYGERG